MPCSIASCCMQAGLQRRAVLDVVHLPRVKTITVRSCPLFHNSPLGRLVVEAGARQRAAAASSSAAWSSMREEEGEVSDPYGRVQDVMTETGLQATSLEASLASIIHKFDGVSGLPVVENDKVVGVITRKDVLTARRNKLNLETSSVKDCYSQPAVTVRQQAYIGEAAGIMLARKLHRLPVTDKAGRLIGIVSQTDVLNPLLHHSIYDVAAVEAQEPHSMHHELANIEREEGAWQVQYLYDGNCAMCRTLRDILQNRDKGKGNIVFVNIAHRSYDPHLHGGVSYEDAMDTIHVIRRDGTIITGPAALRELYSVAGLGWAARLGSLPLISNLVDVTYGLLSKYRLGVGGVDAVVAMRRLQMAEQGVEHCHDDEEECQSAEW